jgi:hypothetical protein
MEDKISGVFNLGIRWRQVVAATSSGPFAPITIGV